jgi:hypothetical protein
MSQDVLLALISALTAYACFEKRTLFHDVLSLCKKRLVDTNESSLLLN